MLTNTVYLLALALISVSASDPLVQLPNGLIQGREDVTMNGKTYYAFEKIPYAAPPVGDLRFQAPVPPENWEGVLNTTSLDVACPQLGLHILFSESEDCLYLNIFTPQLPNEEKNASLPVLFFIHGGAFLTGSSIFYKSDMIIDAEVILITINYRLGIFGFLSTEDEVIPGNAGLKDQHLALQWTHDNIKLFGGDPDKVTIYGQSAGSSSCAYHLLNPKSEGLFAGAILQSGSFLLPSTYQRNSRKIAFVVAALLNETFTTDYDSTSLLNYLQTLDMATITKAVENYRNAHSSPSERIELYEGRTFAAVIEVEHENAFLTRKQYGLLKDGSVVRVPILIGITSEEILGIIDVSNPMYLAKNLPYLDEHLGRLLPADMIVPEESQREEIGSAIRKIYTNESFANDWGAGVRFFSDTGYTRGIIAQAALYSQFAKTYFYQFSYDGTLGGSLVPFHYDGAESVGHAEDLSYIFCINLSGCDLSDYPKSDQQTSQRLIKIWTDFARYQNPTPEPSELLQNISWPEVSTENGDFLYVDIGENLEIKNHPKENSFAKWVEIYDSLNYTDFDTY